MFNAQFSSGRAALWFATAAFGVLGLLSTGVAAREDSKSSLAAKELGETLDRLKLDAIAAPDPSDATSFVAALYFPGAQLLVVSAKYSAPVLLTAKLGKKEYRDIYIDLNSASVPGSKVFIQDMGADGLAFKPEDNGAADTWEEKNTTLAFDGDWRKAKLSEEEYQKRFADADTRYTRMLLLLTGQAKPKSGS